MSNYERFKDLLSRKQFDPVEDNLSMKDLHEIFEEVFLDPSFQRLGGVKYGSGWIYKQYCKYIDNLIKGKTHNAIMLADVRRCLDYAKRMSDQESLDYFQDKLDKGFSYVSVDGNNSHSTIWAFVEGCEVEEKSKNKGKIHSEILKNLIPESNGEYNEIGDPQLKRLLSSNRKTKVIYLREASLKEMCELFRDLNTSESLKGQERRQARITDLACFIRTTSEKFKKVFLKMFNKIDQSAFDQRKVDQFVAEIAVKLSNNYRTALSSDQLDKLYEEVEVLSEDNEKKINFALSTLEKVSKEMEEKFSGIDLGPAHAFIEACFLTYEMGYRVKDHKKFFEWFLKGNADFTTKSAKTLQSGNNKESEVSYKYWVQRPTQSGAYKKLSAVWANNLRARLDHLDADGVVNRIRTHKDTFSFDQKLKALVEQKYKDRSGNDISILDLYTKDKLHADHVKSVKDGGQTVLQNCEIMAAKDNLAKGSDSWDPHFDHQVEQKKASINS